MKSENEKMSNLLLENINSLHTTELGIERIRKNLRLENIDVVEFCKKELQNPNCIITRNGKNWYACVEDRLWTINANSYTIITAHINIQKIKR